MYYDQFSQTCADLKMLLIYLDQNNEYCCVCIYREQAKEGADPHAAGDGLRLRPSEGLETGSGEGRSDSWTLDYNLLLPVFILAAIFDLVFRRKWLLVLVTFESFLSFVVLV